MVNHKAQAIRTVINEISEELTLIRERLDTIIELYSSDSSHHFDD